MSLANARGIEELRQLVGALALSETHPIDDTVILRFTIRVTMLSALSPALRKISGISASSGRLVGPSYDSFRLNFL